LLPVGSGGASSYRRLTLVSQWREKFDSAPRAQGRKTAHFAIAGVVAGLQTDSRSCGSRCPADNLVRGVQLLEQWAGRVLADAGDIRRGCLVLKWISNFARLASGRGGPQSRWHVVRRIVLLNIIHTGNSRAVLGRRSCG
jgi:hypothetical protein